MCSKVTTCLRCDGIFKHILLQILHCVCQRKNFENRLIFGEDMGKSLVSFLDSECSIVNDTCFVISINSIAIELNCRSVSLDNDRQ